MLMRIFWNPTLGPWYSMAHDQVLSVFYKGPVVERMLEREKPQAHHQTFGFWPLPTHAKDKNGETPLQIAAYGGFCFECVSAVECERLPWNTCIYIYIYALRSFIWLSHFLCWLSTTGYFRNPRLVIPPCARSTSLWVENGGFGNWICSDVPVAKNQRLIWPLNIKPPWPKPQNFYQQVLSSYTIITMTLSTSYLVLPHYFNFQTLLAVGVRFHLLGSVVAAALGQRQCQWPRQLDAVDLRRAGGTCWRSGVTWMTSLHCLGWLEVMVHGFFGW